MPNRTSPPGVGKGPEPPQGRCRPFGNPATARVFVIGHDPRLRKSHAKAATVFFLDYLEPGRPTKRSEAAKYDLASETVRYVEYLTGGKAPLREIYFTNLCNKFSPHPKGGGTVLISDDVADRGIAEIEQALHQGKAQVIIPMSLQVFYHLARSGFVEMEQGERERFVRKAAPEPGARDRGAYASTGRAPFLDVCGREFWHGRVPVVPVLHIKSWNSRLQRDAYESAIHRAAGSIAHCLGS